MKIAVVGGGITGLTAAYKLSQKGHQVSIFEKENYLGGLATGFKQKDWDWYLENFFHHLFVSDLSAKKLIKKLGLENRLVYFRPKTSIFYKGKISQFDSPLSVLKFPYLSYLKKIRTGALTAYLKLTGDWQKLEKTSAYDWLKKYYGQKAFKILWQPLIKSKFGKYAPKISMAWFWARIKKRSAKLGYLKGGFQVLIESLVKEIKSNGGKIILNQEIKNLKDLRQKFDRIIITTPTGKFFTKKLPPMLGAANLILISKRRFLEDGTYWLNINEPNFPFVAVVEHTNFIEPKYYKGNHIIYVGGYYPQNHRYFKMTRHQVLKEFQQFLKKINPNFNFQFSVFNFQLTKSFFAQPIVPINYSKILDKFKNSLPKNVYLANMQTIYPWDRGVNYAIEEGEKVADEIFKNP